MKNCRANKNLRNITFLFLVAAVGCSPKSENTQFENLPEKQYEYEPRNEDKTLVAPNSNNFDIESVTGLTRAQQNQTPWLEDSVEIFKLAENSLEMGDKVSTPYRAQYKQFGHDLLRMFYQSKENATQFDRTQTMYLPAALGFEGQRIKGLFSDIASQKNLDGVQAAFRTHHIQWPSTRPALRPIEFIKSIKKYLLGVAPAFVQHGVSKQFVNTFSMQLDKDYIQALDKAEASLQTIDQNQKLKVNATVISDVIKTLTFIPQDAVKTLLDHLVKAKVYANLIEKNHSSDLPQVDRLIQVIAGVWADLTPEQREKYIKPANEMLYSKLNDQSDKMILWLAGRYEFSPAEVEKYWGTFVVKNAFISKLKSSCHPDFRSYLAAWLKMSESQKASLRAQHPDAFNVISRYSTNEIRNDILPSYSDNEFGSFINTGTVGKFVSEVEPVCLSRIQALLDRSINIYLLTELDIQIRQWSDMIEKVVAEKTTGNLVTVVDSITSDEKFKNFFEKMAYPIMEEMLFQSGPINGVENSGIQLMVNSQKQFQTRRLNANEFETGAEVLGTSLAAQYRRILGLPEFEGKAVNSKEYYRVVFSQINKMLAMIGFRTMDNKLVPSLHKKFYGDMNDRQTADLDVYKYECGDGKKTAQDAKKARYADDVANGKTPSHDDYVDIREDCDGYTGYSQSLFEIPDRFKMAGAFLSTNSYQKYSSIKAQSEIIRGAAYMLQYFSDWKGPNAFDAGMGKETFSDITVFPKSALVNLAVAAMTTPIRSLQKAQSPLKLFNMEGQELDWVKNGLPDPKKSDSADPKSQIMQAAIVSLLSNGPSRVVKAEDMAYFVVAVDEFLKATDGIEMTHASVINPPNKTVKDNMEAILKGRRLLKMVMFAMSNFMVNRLQDEDGGFWSTYDLESQKVVNKEEPRTLRVQLAVIDALLRVYDQWKSEGSLVAAVESYYYMNQKLWNDKVAFYKSSEESVTNDVKPDLYLKAVMNFNRITPYLKDPNSVTQAKTMFDYYSKEFLKWNQSTKPMSTYTF